MQGFNKKELKVLRKLNKPWLIQDYLDTIPINFEKNGKTLMSPRRVMQTKKAHCFEGAIFAAAALWVNGAPPLLMDLYTTRNDSSHVVALFKYGNRWGAISKTNHAVLRYRDPVYRSIHELGMSYFNEYFLDNGRKTLLSYSNPLDLRRFEKRGWTTSEKDLLYIDDALNYIKHHEIVPTEISKIVRRASHVERKAGKITEW